MVQVFTDTERRGGYGNAIVLGYVGMTGLATGPHLHYEYLMNGVHMNPQTVRLPGA